LERTTAAFFLSLVVGQHPQDDRPAGAAPGSGAAARAYLVDSRGTATNHLFDGGIRDRTADTNEHRGAPYLEGILNLKMTCNNNLSRTFKDSK
jgi:hypothetical protein